MNFIDDINQAWRFASVRLAVIAGIIAAWAAAYPQDFAQLVGALPEWARPLIGLAVFAAATLARVTKVGGQDTPQ
ncbi:MAG: hypothetical protein WCL10_18800 [Novosphingobium sp.]|uniref:DUF7940 domain-containing protein n=1 Tax=Novosphingobium sp. TaxID=1874826 RepID=UPI003016108A